MLALLKFEYIRPVKRSRLVFLTFRETKQKPLLNSSALSVKHIEVTAPDAYATHTTRAFRDSNPRYAAPERKFLDRREQWLADWLNR